MPPKLRNNSIKAKISSADLWNGEKRMMQKYFYSILGRHTEIVDIIGGGDLGFTSGDGKIHIAEKHSLMASLNEEERSFFRLGVFAHELLHQEYTDFDYMNHMDTMVKDRNLKETAFLFFNLVEDPAIEYRGSQVFGGLMLQALRFSIRHIFHESPGIEASRDPFTQLINSLVQFGDEGMIKGEFTYRESWEAFKLIAPEFDYEVVHGTSHSRLDAAFRWADMTRPLWDRHASSDRSTESVKGSLLRENGKSQPSGSGSPRSDGNETPSKEEAHHKRRAEAAKKLKEDTKNGSQTTKNDYDRSSVAGAKGRSKDDGWKTESSAFTSEDWEADDKVDSTSGISKEDFKSLLTSARKEIQEEAESKIHQDRNLGPIIAKPACYLKDFSCCNEKAVIKKGMNCEILYQRLLESNGQAINRLEKKLEKLFKTDLTEDMMSSSGRYNIIRGTIGTTAAIFDRKKSPEGMAELAVMLLIDESGSMHGKKAAAARDTAVILTESFARLNIPCYVMGFTADMSVGGKSYDVIHHHFVSWTNTKQERMSLAMINAYMTNCDGYSIRCAASIMAKKSAANKLLFVISDGLPSGGVYRQGVDGYSDTSAAIIEAKRVAGVIGIGIGDTCPEDTFRTLYQGAYIPVKNPKDLPQELTRILEARIKCLLR